MKSVMPDWVKAHVEEEWLRSMATDGMENKNLGHWQNAWRSSTLDQVLTHSRRTGGFRTIISTCAGVSRFNQQLADAIARSVTRIFLGVRWLSLLRLPNRFHSLCENRLKNIPEILSAKQKYERSKRRVKQVNAPFFSYPLFIFSFALFFDFFFLFVVFFFMYLRDFNRYAIAQWSKSR